ncbi:tetratricopeptide repeat protein [Roseateles sp.]|uniref:tetratricopeptide repeat protein n=1 Tax=Roseateles sp. TaxID=1971397 RepID=UPI003BA7E901
MQQRPSFTLRALTAFALAAGLGVGQASIFKDPQLDSLAEANKFAELEQQAQARLKANAADVEANAALALALSSLDPSDAKRLEAGAKQAKQCVEQHPSAAVCQLVRAQNLHMQMGEAGMFKAMRLLDSIKEALTRAVELDPNSFVARVQLTKLYLFAPGMLGGSTAKAKELEIAVRSSQPEQARLLRVYLALYAKKWGEAESELLALKPSKDASLLEEARAATLQLATYYLKDGKEPAKAKTLFENLQREQPGYAHGPYGLGRVYSETGQLDEALRYFERAKSLAAADELPIDHRLGDALLAKGDKAQAKAAYERFLKTKRANPNNVEAARKSLASLV